MVSTSQILSRRTPRMERDGPVSHVDQTRSWSSSIAAVDDPYTRLPPPQNRPSIGPPVEERRVDGDRYTQFAPASEWLRDKEKESNQLRRTPNNSGPPTLARNSTRDHLSDVNREHVLYDPARPDLPTRVRVTRRTTFDNCSYDGKRAAFAHEKMEQQMRARQRDADAELEAAEAAEANELLELRSMGIRGVMARADTGAAATRSPIVTRSVSRAASAASGAPPATPTPDASSESSATGAGATWGVSPPQAAEGASRWDVARVAYRPTPTIDGKPIDLNLAWITAPLKRHAEGARRDRVDTDRTRQWCTRSADAPTDPSPTPLCLARARVRRRLLATLTLGVGACRWQASSPSRRPSRLSRRRRRAASPATASARALRRGTWAIRRRRPPHAAPRPSVRQAECVGRLAMRAATKGVSRGLAEPQGVSGAC